MYDYTEDLEDIVFLPLIDGTTWLVNARLRGTNISIRETVTAANEEDAVRAFRSHWYHEMTIAPTTEN